MAAPALPDGYALECTPPLAHEYFRLRNDTDLTGMSPTQSAGAVASPANWAFRTVRLRGTGEAVGMGRLISDGAWYFLVADVAVLPPHQRRGLGRAIMTSLLEEIRDRAEPGAYVTLTGDAPGQRLYESLGFRHMSERGASGMEMVVR